MSCFGGGHLGLVGDYLYLPDQLGPQPERQPLTETGATLLRQEYATQFIKKKRPRKKVAGPDIEFPPYQLSKIEYQVPDGWTAEIPQAFKNEVPPFTLMTVQSYRLDLDGTVSGSGDIDPSGRAPIQTL